MSAKLLPPLMKKIIGQRSIHRKFQFQPPRNFHSVIDTLFERLTGRRSKSRPLRPPTTETPKPLLVSERRIPAGSAADADDDYNAHIVGQVQNILNLRRDGPADHLEQALDQLHLSLTDDLVLAVLRRHAADWKPALGFFNWVSSKRGGSSSPYSPGSKVYNEIIGILGKMRRFDQLHQVLDEMSERKGLINERTIEIVIHRYAAAHMIEEATQFFYKREQYGLQLDLAAFQALLMALCRYKHVEAAEFLFLSKQDEFRPDIKSRNIILNGWCVSGRLPETKRFWNDIIASGCTPDVVTYGTFINSLTKAGKLATAVKLFQTMWNKGCPPDVTICNCIIDALCFKKKIPEALGVFSEMRDRDCLPNTVTYNSLIKHLCHIRRMEKVYELLDEMEHKGDCLPNARTYGYLLKATNKPEDVVSVLERMERNGCKLTADTYNLVLKLYMNLGDLEKVESTWFEMERSGSGLDQRSYTIMVHGFYEKKMMKDALSYYREMVSKGMVPEPRTKVLVDAIRIKLEKYK